MNGAFQTAACAECRTAFAIGSMIRYGGSYVCVTCKPVFMQKLSEGVNLGGAMRNAGFWIRVGAMLLDVILTGFVLAFLFFVAMAIFIGSIMGSIPEPGQPPPDELILFFIAFYAFTGIFYLLYETLFTAQFGGTPGKLICGLRVVTADGGRITYLRSLARSFGKALNYLILFIGFIMVAFDEEKRGLHDRICDTRVILK